MSSAKNITLVVHYAIVDRVTSRRTPENLSAVAAELPAADYALRFSAITMVVFSLLTTPPPQYKITDNVSASVAGQSLGGTGYGSGPAFCLFVL